MDLGLSEVQQMLKSSAQEFLSQECPLTLVREMEEDSAGDNDQLWRQISSLGWTGVAFPESYGGTGGDFLDLAVLLEEMGRALCPSPFFSTVVLGGMTVLDAGSDAQKNDIITQICDGQMLMTLALTEQTASYEAWGVETVATRQGDNYVLEGTKLFVPDAHVASLILVAARTSDNADPAQGISLFLVPSGTSGITVTQMSTISADRQCEVVLNQVTVPASSVLGEIDQGWQILQRTLERATAGECIEMLGGAAAVVDMTVEYVKGRTQFGRPIGSFQAVQHHCANMATDVEGSRVVAYQAAWKVSEGVPAQREVSVAKAWVSAAYQRVCSTSHQTHGAIGFTKEHDLQLYTRRAKVQELNYGDVNFHKDVALQYMERELA